MLLSELTGSVTKLRGVGPAVAAALARLEINTVRDVLLHVPRSYENRKDPAPLSAAFEGGTVNTVAEVIAHDYVGPPQRRTLKVYVRDESHAGALVCFGRNFLARKLPPGTRIFLTGRFSYRFGELQASSFEFEQYSPRPRAFGSILPVYGLTEGLSQPAMRKIVRSALAEARHVEDEVPHGLRRRAGLMTKSRALAALHEPDTLEEAEEARRSLAFDELFVYQSVVARRVVERNAEGRPPKALPRDLQNRLLRALPFSLTPDQKQVLEEILQDLGEARPMARLLQGDVGSGKTLVAFLAALPYVELGYQTAFVAPTELLARQHAENAARFLEPLGVRIAFLSGTVKSGARTPLLEAVAAGDVDIVVGTHAVFTEEVAFRDLRLVIIDEQHRFGVRQRELLIGKGKRPDVLLMTATPIPRTLALTVFGDMDTSVIRTMPPGRKPVRTHLARQENERKVYERVRRELADGRQAYFVYPLVQESEKLSLRDAESMYERLDREVFPEFEVALIHSRIPEDQKAERMARFTRGEVDVLVATSVVEVGVDVANATCLVVEHAERFGLAALHQLRGRVGRGKAQSYAFFVYDDHLTEEAKQRLRVLHEHSDGFTIAEEDLKIRGPGELTGTRQSGYVRFRVAELARDMDLMNRARSEAFEMLEHDPSLRADAHRLLARAVELAAREMER
ncbi:MAG: ATP-dependent DNA helicase RecG [Spirochaetaceae bacterium]